MFNVRLVFLIIALGLSSCGSPRYGYINRQGIPLTAFHFQKAEPFQDGMACVVMGDYGFIDVDGDWVVEPILDGARCLSEGLAASQRGDLWGYIDSKGNWVIDPLYYSTSSFDGDYGIVWTKDSTTHGVIDKQGTLLFSTHRWLDRLSKERVIYEDDQANKWGLLDLNGKEVTGPIFDLLLGVFGDEGLIAAWLPGAFESPRWGFIDRNGNWVIQPKYLKVEPFSEGLALVETATTGLYINHRGDVVIESQWLNASSFSEGLARVGDENRYGYMDKTGKLVIPLQFKYTEFEIGKCDFHDGLAPIKISDKWGYIDTTGRVVIQPKYDFVSPFSEGFAAVGYKK